MFAGKTTYILNSIRRHQNSIVFKPAIDDRYSINEIVTHDGAKIEAISVSIPDDLMVTEKYDAVFFDEIQFFSPPHFGGDIVTCIKVLLEHGKTVVANGLDMDWRGDPFEVTGRLLAMADEVIKLQAKSVVCRQPANKTYKKARDENDEQIVIGGDDIYEARCNAHWHYDS